MSYTLQKAWAAADGLSDTSPDKVVSGSDFQTEFEAVQTEFGNKANTTSPTLGGTPLAPTASAGTDSTQIATTAFVVNLIKAIYPVGSLYTTTDSTNPSASSRLGFGVWVAYGEGKVLVGIDSTDTDFAAVNDTGGRKDAVTPEHTHTINYSNTTDKVYGSYDGNRTFSDVGGSATSETTSSTGDSLTGNENLQPYTVVYMWKRTV
jgi:hypothetical protein